MYNNMDIFEYYLIVDIKSLPGINDASLGSQ